MFKELVFLHIMEDSYFHAQNDKTQAFIDMRRQTIQNILEQARKSQKYQQDLQYGKKYAEIALADRYPTNNKMEMIYLIAKHINTNLDLLKCYKCNTIYNVNELCLFAHINIYCRNPNCKAYTSIYDTIFNAIITDLKTKTEPSPLEKEIASNIELTDNYEKLLYHCKISNKKLKQFVHVTSEHYRTLFYEILSEIDFNRKICDYRDCHYAEALEKYNKYLKIPENERKTMIPTLSILLMSRIKNQKINIPIIDHKHLESSYIHTCKIWYKYHQNKYISRKPFGSIRHAWFLHKYNHTATIQAPINDDICFYYNQELEEMMQSMKYHYSSYFGCCAINIDYPYYDIYDD